MRLISISIKGYIPLQHGGIETLTISQVERIMCLVGENGSGKSALFSELTPLPSTSTDYDKGGFKTLMWEHNGDIIETGSDFSASKAFHTFKVDGVDLNVSGTSPHQIQLCQTYLGITPAARELLSGIVKWTEKTPEIRKQLLMSLFPSDFTFVTEAHRAVQSKIRTTKAVVESLTSRIAELETKALTKQELEILEAQLETVRSIKQQLETSRAIQQSHLVSIDQPSIKNGKLLRKELTAILNGGYQDAMTPAQAGLTLLELETLYRKVFSEKHALDSRASTLHVEILELEELIAASSIEQLKHFETELLDLSQQLQEIPEPFRSMELKDLSEPRFNSRQLGRLKGHITELNEGCGDQLISIEEVKVRSDKRTVCLQTLHEAEYQIAHNQKIVERSKEELLKIDVSTFREGCDLPCMAKDRLLYSKEACLETIRCATECIRDNEAIIEKLQKEISDLSKWIDLNASKAELLKRYKFFIQQEMGMEFDPSSMTSMNYYNKQLQTTSTFDAVLMADRLKTRIVELSQYIQAMEDQLAKRDQATITRHTCLKDELISTNSKLTELSSNLENLSHKIHQVKGILSRNAQRKSLASQLKSLTDTNRTKTVNELLKTSIKEIDRSLIAVNATLLKLEAQREESMEVHIRLYKELQPELDKSKTILNQLIELEVKCSPNTGIVREILVEFLNSIIELANMHIETSWSYRMELAPIEFGQVLDMKFPIYIFAGNKPLPDIKILSTAQAAFVNLAFTLALLEICGYASVFPLKIDEIDAGATPGHRTNLVTKINEIMQQDRFVQMLIINHHKEFYSRFNNLQICCLMDSGIDGMTTEFDTANVKIT